MNTKPAASSIGEALLDRRLDPPPGLWIRAVARVASWILPLEKAAPDPAKLRRVLIVRPDDRVGNALLTIPLARALATALPEAQIDLLLSSSRAQVARGLAGFGLVEFDKRESFRHPIRFLRFLFALRARSYDVAIDAAHWHAFSLTSALLTRLATRNWTIGSARGPSFLYSQSVPLPAKDVQEVEAKLGLAAALLSRELPIPPLETTLGRSFESEASARSAREKLGLGDRFAALNPGSRKLDHRWDASKFAALARALFEQHQLRSLVLWGPGEEALARAIVEEGQGCAVFAPPTDLDALAAHLRASSLAVTNDTGPMHLAVACGAPVLAIFLAADGLRWGHPGARFAAVDVRALERNAGKCGSPAPLADLRAAEDAAAALLALTGSASGESLPNRKVLR